MKSIKSLLIKVHPVEGVDCLAVHVDKAYLRKTVAPRRGLLDALKSHTAFTELRFIDHGHVWIPPDVLPAKVRDDVYDNCVTETNWKPPEPAELVRTEFSEIVFSSQGVHFEAEERYSYMMMQSVVIDWAEIDAL